MQPRSTVGQTNRRVVPTCQSRRKKFNWCPVASTDISYRVSSLPETKILGRGHSRLIAIDKAASSSYNALQTVGPPYSFNGGGSLPKVAVPGDSRVWTCNERRCLGAVMRLVYPPARTAACRLGTSLARRLLRHFIKRLHALSNASVDTACRSFRLSMTAAGGSDVSLSIQLSFSFGKVRRLPITRPSSSASTTSLGTLAAPLNP